jgi:hypothetical protein
MTLSEFIHLLEIYSVGKMAWRTPKPLHDSSVNTAPVYKFDLNVPSSVLFYAINLLKYILFVPSHLVLGYIIEPSIGQRYKRCHVDQGFVSCKFHAMYTFQHISVYILFNNILNLQFQTRSKRISLTIFRHWDVFHLWKLRPKLIPRSTYNDPVQYTHAYQHRIIAINKLYLLL